jgi:hypothetical protein
LTRKQIRIDIFFGLAGHAIVFFEPPVDVIRFPYFALGRLQRSLHDVNVLVFLIDLILHHDTAILACFRLFAKSPLTQAPPAWVRIETRLDFFAKP